MAEANGWEMIAIRSYIRLAKGHEAKELKPYVNKMREDHFPLKEMKNMGVELNYDFTVLSDVYTQDPYIKKMGWIMGIMAFVLLFTSVMNYLLIIVGNLVGRSREMAVRKCYGAEPRRTFMPSSSPRLWCMWGWRLFLRLFLCSFARELSRISFLLR